MVVGGGFEPPKLTQQIYSLPPLATREPHQNKLLDAICFACELKMRPFLPIASSIFYFFCLFIAENEQGVYFVVL